MKKIFLILFAVTALSIHSIYPQLKNELRKNLDEYMTRLTELGYSGARLVAKEGEVIVSKGCGLANRKQTPVSPETIFTIGSITKQFTAAAILKLEMHGKLNVQDLPPSQAPAWEGKQILRSATPSRFSLNNIIMKSGGGARSPSRLPRPDIPLKI